MKKGFTIKAILLVLVVALTCGCVKVEVGLKITNSDVAFTYVMGMQKAYISMMNGEGDPFKDTAGPSINTQITVISLISSLCASLFYAYALFK